MQLVDRLMRYFPDATNNIYVHSVLPVRISNPYTMRNVLAVNDMLLDCCRSQKLYFLNFFNDFVDIFGYREVWLFSDDVHPNARGMGIIASQYINLIHNKRFDPFILGYYG